MKIIKIIALPLIFLLLILFNQKKAQNEILNSKPPLYKVSLVNPILNTLANQPAEFTWNVEAPNTATTLTTTIYYGSTSSPSALTIKDSPEAVGYSRRLTDYLDGKFFLPDTFSATAKLLKGTYFYRAYAKVDNQHLWSQEHQLSVK